MKITKELRSRIVSAVEEKKLGRAADVARAMKVSEATLSRVFSGNVKAINDATADKISRFLKIPLSEMLVLSMGGVPKPGEIQSRRFAVCEDPEKYSDLYDRLAGWLRLEATDDKKKAVLMAAQAMGFQDRGVTGALDALCEPARRRAG